jgi:predicted lipid-binding transport protein (Tim44 family)
VATSSRSSAVVNTVRAACSLSRRSAVAVALFALISFLVINFTLALGVAEAKPLGGGKSVGKQPRQGAAAAAAAKAKQVPPSAPQAPQAAATVAAPAPIAAAAAPARSRWTAPLAGAAAGLGLAALASHYGFAEEIASFVLFMIALAAVMLAVRWLFSSRRTQVKPQFWTPNYSYSGVGQEAMVALQYTRLSPGAALRQEAPVIRPSALLPPNVEDSAWRIPDDFDSEIFLRQAKSQFVRLQAAHDSADLEQLADFTAPDLFENIRAQIAARPKGQNRTEILSLNAALLGVHSNSIEHRASVRFQGSMRERSELAAEAFDEVWSLTKPVDGSAGWLLAAVQTL